MSFLAPLFLAGLALVAAPILFHLIRQIPRKRIIFSSSELLEASEPKTEKSRRIQNPLLLIIRCAIISLLAFAFARPFVPAQQNPQPASGVRRDVVIAIDQSSSMRRGGLQEQAILRAKAIASELGEADQISIFGFADTITPLVSAAQWSALAADRRLDFAAAQLEKWTPNQRPGFTDLALAEAAGQIEVLREKSAAASFGEIFLISDFAQGTRLNEVDSIEWPADLNVSRIQVSPTAAGPNLGLSWLGWSKSQDGAPLARIAVSSTHPEQAISARLTTRNAITRVQIGEPLELILQHESPHTMNVPIGPAARGEPLLFTLEGDAQAFDNTLHVAPPYIPKLRIGLVSSSLVSDPNDSPYFIAKGVQGFENPLTTLEGETPLGSSNQAFIVNRPLSATEAATLRQQIEGGKSGIVLASSTDYADTLRALTANRNWSVNERQPGHLLIGSVDLSHPFFSPFADARFSNFAAIRFWKSMQLTVPDDENYAVVARFDDGTPLLAEVTLGEGRLYIWASSWSPQAAQWILSSKFIPFLHRFAKMSAGGPDLESNAILAKESAERYEQLLGKTHSFEAGLYPALGTGDRWVAFQASPQESQTETLSDDDWDSLGLPEFDKSQQLAQIQRIADSSEKEASTQTEKRQGIWKWLLWCVLALLAVESFVAIGIAKQREAVAP